MLVLTRRSGESIVIGGEIRIRVLHASGSRVRIGIEAPADVRITREKAEPVDPLPSATPARLRDEVVRSSPAALPSQRTGSPPRETAIVEMQAPGD